MPNNEQILINPTSNITDAQTLQGQNGAYYLDRVNHTGTQLASTISDFSEAAMLRNSFVLVKSKSDLPTPVSGVITLSDNTTYEINGQIVLGADYIELGASNIIYGVDKSDDGLVYTGTGAAIRGTDKDFSLRSFYLVSNNASGSALGVTSSGTNIAEIAEIIFNGCSSLGSASGFDVFVFRNNLTINCADGFTMSGVNDDVFFTDNIFKESATATNPTYLDFSGTYSVGILDRNHFEVDTSEVAINVDNTTTIGNVFSIVNNVITGNGSGLTGINANQTGFNIPAKSNFGIAGKLVFKLTLVLQAWSTTSASYLEIPETVPIESADFYEDGATTIEASLTASVSHDQSGNRTDIELYNLTDGLSIASSEIQTTVTSAGVYEVVSSPSSFTITGDKEYRVRLRRGTGSGQNDALIRSCALEIMVY